MYAFLQIGKRVRTPAAVAADDVESDGSPPSPADDAVAEHRAAHAAWQARLEKAMDGSFSIAHGRMLREAFLAEDPEPLLEGQGLSASGEAGVGAAGDESEVEVWWSASVEDVAEVDDVWLCRADEPFPRTGVAKVLTELERSGWAVAHVTEERQVVHDEAASRTEVLGAWILLRSGVDGG